MPPNKNDHANKPFFSVIIPSVGKLRIDMVEKGVRSALGQSFTDLEVLLSDNSGSEKLLSIGRKYAFDKRFNYIHPGSIMNMPDHWEWVSRKANGQYILVLTDRTVMKPSALKVLHSLIISETQHPDLVSWNDKSHYDEISGICVEPEFTDTVTRYDGISLAVEFTKLNADTTLLPHALNSCYRSDLAETIRKKHGKLFVPVAPDYTSAFLLLCYAKEILFLDHALYVRHGDFFTSNGAVAALRGPDAYLATLGEIDAYEHVPLRVPVVINYIMNDMFRIRQIVGPEKLPIWLDIEKYLLTIYEFILIMESKGATWDTGQAYRSVWDYIRTLAPPQQATMRGKLKILEKEKRKAWRGWGLRMIHHCRMWKIALWVRARQRQLQHVLGGLPTHKDVLEAALKKDCSNVEKQWQPKRFNSI